MTKMTKKTAIIYLRVSSTQQARKELPIESQLDNSLKKAKQLNAVVLKVFTDSGISGRTSKRADFQAAIAYCEVHKPDYFIAWDTSRFARDRADASTYKKKLREEGTDVVYVSVSIDSKTDEGWMMEAMLELMDENTSRRISKDTKRSMMKNAEDGFFNGGHIPFGYQIAKEGQRKRLAICDNEAEIVKTMFKLCESGLGSHSIAKSMNNMGHSMRGKPWYKSTVIYLLKSEIYSGFTVFNRRKHHTNTYTPESEWVRTKSHPAIIDEDKFMKIQKMITSRAPVEGGGSPKSTHMFTGILKCGLCNCSMHIESSTSGSKKQYDYYRCSSAKNGFDCLGKRIGAPAIDAFLVGTILDRILTKKNVTKIIEEIRTSTSDWWRDRRRRREAAVAELRTAETKRGNLFDLLETHGTSMPDIRSVSGRLSELNKQIEALGVTLATLEDEKDPVLTISDEDIVAATASLRNLVTTESSVATARTFFSSFVKTITVNEDRVVINYDPAKIMNHEQSIVHSKDYWLPDLDSNQGPAD
jgi:site-specific DNA recombinase